MIIIQLNNLIINPQYDQIKNDIYIYIYYKKISTFFDHYLPNKKIFFLSRVVRSGEYTAFGC